MIDMVETLVKGWACIIATGVLFLLVFCCGNLGVSFLCAAGGIFFLNLACKVVNNGPDEMKKIMSEYERECKARKSARAEKSSTGPIFIWIDKK